MIQSSAERVAKTDLLKFLLDAVPVPALVVDDELRILQANLSALHEFNAEVRRVFTESPGALLDCLHATEPPGGCGGSASCGDCVVRGSVRTALNGEGVSRMETTMQLHRGGDVRELTLLVTAAPLESRNRPSVLLIFEDISELARLRGLLPVCSSCKKRRDDEAYWKEIDAYIGTSHDAGLYCGLCGECGRELNSNHRGN